MATVPSTDDNIVTGLLIGLNPSNMFHLIDNHTRIENLVRNNLEIFVNAYRNHPDILDDMIWNNFDGTYEEFYRVLQMHNCIFTTDDDYFYNQFIHNVHEHSFHIPTEPALAYKFKLVILLLAKRVGFHICFILLIAYPLDYTDFRLQNDPFDILLILFKRYPNFCKFERNSKEADNIFLIHDVIMHFEDMETQDFDYSYDIIDNMISNGAHPNEAFKYLLESDINRRQFIFYLNLGFSSKNASHLVTNPPTESQMEQYNNLKNNMEADALFNLLYPVLND